MLKVIFQLWDLCTTGMVCYMQVLFWEGFSRSWDNDLITLSTDDPIWRLVEEQDNLKQFLPGCFVWFLLRMQKVTRVILSSLVGFLWPGRHLVLQTAVWWEKRLVVHPKIVQKNIPKTPQGLLFKGVTDANDHKGQVSANVKISKAPCWTSCPWRCPKPFLQWWPMWWPCSERHTLVPKQTESDTQAAKSCWVYVCNSIKGIKTKAKLDALNKQHTTIPPSLVSRGSKFQHHKVND